jgi:hypothetical protein
MLSDYLDLDEYTDTTYNKYLAYNSDFILQGNKMKELQDLSERNEILQDENEKLKKQLEELKTNTVKTTENSYEVNYY